VKLDRINIPSPTESLSYQYGEDKQVSFWMKRDDLIHPDIVGNKWRKISGYFDHFDTSDQKGIVTCGGPYSNHLLATAGACALYGIRCSGFIRGDYYKKENDMIGRMRTLGMSIHFLSNQDFDQLNIDPARILSQYELHDSLFVPMGGQSSMGEVGCRAIVNEVIDAQLRPDIWLVAAGTSTTASGIIQQINYPCEVWVYPAVDRKTNEIGALKAGLSKLNDQVEVQIMNPHRCRFGKVDDALVDFVDSFHRQTDILLDPLYNGKMMESFFSEYAGVLAERKVLAYHSGGMAGWSGFKLFTEMI